MKKIFFLSLFLLFLFSNINAQDIIKKGNVYYLSNTVIVKLKQNYSINSITSNKNTAKISVNQFSKLFPSYGILNKGEQNLDRIYLLKYVTSEDPLKAAESISKQPGVEWAEPKYVRTITYSPNDSLYLLNKQLNLQRIDAIDAWQISTGDTTVHIAVVDIGVDWHHPDLSANILKNPSGQLIGYDFGGLNGTPDNDPSEDSTVYHGTHVAGIASAVTNNEIGIASIGNTCKLIPIKVSRFDQRAPDVNGVPGAPYIVYGFEGIKLAADLGAKVINCSWGGYSYSSLEQETIDYAVSKGSLVVASQGNDGKSDPFYPADYDGVLSVGWLDTFDDQISWEANYGMKVKVYAPGNTILSTWPTKSGKLYNGNLSGSSMAAPLVSGLAGLVFSKFPKFTPLQVSEQIRVTADNIASSNADSLKYLTGSGRINAFKALSDTNAVSVRAQNVTFIDEGNGNGLLESGETASIEINFVNYLKSIQNVSVDISCSDASVNLTNTHFDTGALATNGSVSNNANKFRFNIYSNAPLDHDVNFFLKFSGSGYSNDFQWITAHINPTYGIHNVGDLNVTVTSKGDLAFSDFPNNTAGTGFLFRNSENLMFEGALMYGISSNQIMNDARVLENQSADFITKTPIKITNVGADQVGYTVFSDAGASNPLGIETHMTSYTYSEKPNNGFIILNTSFHNTTSNDITGLYAGYYIDWDIPSSDYSHDTTYYDSQNNIAVAVNNNKNDLTVYKKVYTGTSLISAANLNSYIYYGINNAATSDSVILSDDNGFSDKEKWFALSKGNNTKTAGGDISLVVSGGPFIIRAKDSINVAYAIAAATTIDSLRTAILLSKTKYSTLVGIKADQNKLPDSFALFQNYPNPFNPSTVISYQISDASLVQIKIYDVLGKEVNTLINEQKTVGKYNVVWNGTDNKGSKVSSGVYMYRIQTIPLNSNTKGFTSTKKMVLIK